MSALGNLLDPSFGVDVVGDGLTTLDQVSGPDQIITQREAFDPQSNVIYFAGCRKRVASS